MKDTALALICEGISKAVNHALEFDPLTSQKLKTLAGKSLLIEATAPRLTICILFSETQLTIIPSDGCATSSHLSGTTPALIRFVLAGDIDAAAKCQVESNDGYDLIPTLLTLSRQIDIDWEALLAEHTSDVPAHLLSQLLRHAKQFQQDFATRSKKGWETYTTDTQANDKELSPLDFLSAQLKALLP